MGLVGHRIEFWIIAVYTVTFSASPHCHLSEQLPLEKVCLISHKSEQSMNMKIQVEQLRTALGYRC